MTAFPINQFGENFHFLWAIIFSKFLDKIEKKVPKHQEKKQIFKNSSTCAFDSNIISIFCDPYCHLHMICNQLAEFEHAKSKFAL